MNSASSTFYTKNHSALTLNPGAVEILGILVRELWREDETTFYLGTGEEGFVSWSDSY